MGGNKNVRRESDLRRGEAKRKPRESILVVCEGAKTEPYYFRGLWQAIRLATVEVQVVGEGAEIVGVVDAAIRLRDQRAQKAKESVWHIPYDEVWCVVDTERKNDNASWQRGVDRANKHRLKLAWSNPCFEYWLLLHFVQNGSSFDGYSSLRSYLCKYISNYQKSTDCFEQLAPRVPTAIRHAKQIDRAQWTTTPNPIDRNPGTAVHVLVEKLIKVAEMTIKQYQDRFPLPDPAQTKTNRPRQP